MSEHARAAAAHAAGALDAAESHYRTALGASPEDPRLLRDFAVLLMQTGRQAEAADLLDRPGVDAHGDADLLSILALCLRAAGRYPRALEVAGRIPERDPSSALGWLLLGSLRVLTGDAMAAEPPLRRAIAIAPAFAEAWHYLGESLQAQRRWDEAIDAYGIAAEADPAEAVNVAICQEMAGRLDAATQVYEALHRRLPRRADVLARLAQVQAMQCLHADADKSSARLATLLGAPLAADDLPEPFALSLLELPAAEVAAALSHYATRYADERAPTPVAARTRTMSDGRLRIGYLSADFGGHAVGTLVRSHFAAHDRVRFQVNGYSLRRHDDPIADEIRRGFDAFTDCDALGDEAVAERIRRDGIDVLVDMAGFTHGARPRILAMRPAPLQLGWLGFVHAQEAPWLDGLLMDAHVLPEDAAWPFSDRIVRLDGTLFPASPLPRGQANRERFGLPAGTVVLASFNNAYKLDAPLLRAWTRILSRAPAARLVVYLPPHARPGFMQEWRASGGSEDRLHVVDKLSASEQSDRAASCDLLLDAFRYQGGATSISAIADGLPVLSLAGRSPLARLGVSLNRFLGMDDCVAGDIDAYVERAVALATDRGRLDRVRDTLRRRSEERGLFDPRRAAAAIERVALDWVR